MPGLTVTEKNHWNDRIGRRIDKRIEALTASEANFMDHLKQRARERALQSLGLAELKAEQAQIELEEERLERRDRQVKREMLARLRGVAVEECQNIDDYVVANQVELAVGRRESIHRDELLAETPAGQQVLALQREKDDLLDTVWLATSPAQVKVLWTKVAELLGDQQTPLMRDAVAIEPVTD